MLKFPRSYRHSLIIPYHPRQGRQGGTVHRTKPDGSGQIAAPVISSDKLPFSKVAVVELGSVSKLDRGDEVQFTVEADPATGRWVATLVAFVSRPDRAPPATMAPATMAPATTLPLGAPSAAPPLGFGGWPAMPPPPFPPPGMSSRAGPSPPFPPVAMGTPGGHRGVSNLPAWMESPGASSSALGGVALGGAVRTPPPSPPPPPLQLPVTPSPVPAQVAQAFIGAPTFAGAVAGYSFSSGPMGQGYYLEDTGVHAAAQTAPTEAAAQAAAPPAPDAASLVDPSEALGKVGKALVNPKKLGKALAVLWRLMEAQLSSDTAPLFLKAIMPAFLPAHVPRVKAGGVVDGAGGGVHPPETAAALAALFGALLAKIELFADCEGGAGRGLVMAMAVGAGAKAGLQTDDSFAFAKHMK